MHGGLCDIISIRVPEWACRLWLLVAQARASGGTCGYCHHSLRPNIFQNGSEKSLQGQLEPHNKTMLARSWSDSNHFM